MGAKSPRLEIRFRGRVIEHLGIDMYQSPVAAIAELISNAWDADASSVEVVLPGDLNTGSEISIRDDGFGMTLAQCQDRYLNVGYNKRKENGKDVTGSGRPMMGRKGIGKFAGFGIANFVRVETVSGETGERTVFELDASQLIEGADSYAQNDPLEVDVIDYDGPAEDRCVDHGTTITLRSLTLKKTPNADQFRTSMARRFLLLERADEFAVSVNGERIAEVDDIEKIEFSFPRDYEDSQRPANLTVDDDGWGVERLVNGHQVKWRFVFYKEPISDDELTGVSIFSHYKLAQRPFLFNLTGGFGGQQGTSYLSGRVEADFLDDQPRDLISTERQRVNWEAEASEPLLAWGQARVKSLLRIWQGFRAQAKVTAMRDRMAPFSIRLGRLERPERKVVEKALESIAKITTLSDEQFADLAQAMLSAWEGGRLKGLIDDLASADELDADALVKILAQSRVMSALHAAEHVKAQLNLITGLEERVQRRELENHIRDYIAENPWLISPRWETFRVERGVRGLMEEVAKEIYGKDWDARVDLVLSSGNQLLVVEFMRPGLKIDWDHLGRYERYVTRLRNATAARFSEFKSVSGLLVADKLDKAQDVMDKIEKLRQDDMEATDWLGLLERSKKQWADYFEILHDRAPDDDRMKQLAGN
ncbi:ATP-binding protein [Streptomyces sp. NBC_00328]|uniref:ATP-binding protein n=1 Tax=Streptomyces sp. NBC_00328 TaxID=2903646 RepID=UPI002E2BF898|nr:ATP-binding protein [Streptomyces sp. NBC_00328]